MLPPNSPYQGLILVTRDTTWRRDMEKNGLHEAGSEAQPDDEAFPDIYLRLDNEGLILACHSTDTRHLWPPDQIFGQRAQDILPSPVSSVMAAALAEVSRTRRPVRLEYELSVGGVMRCFEARLQPLLDAQIVAIIRDVGCENSEKTVAPLEVTLLQEALEAALQRNAPAALSRHVTFSVSSGCCPEVLARPEALASALDMLLRAALQAACPHSALTFNCEACFVENAAVDENHMQGRVRMRISGQGSADPATLTAAQETLAAIDGAAGVEQSHGIFSLWIDLAAARVV
jgi:hypothetical protein